MNTMFALLDQRAKPLIVARRRKLRLPHAALAILDATLASLTNKTAERAWQLPPTALTDEVNHYRLRHKTLSANGPRPKLRSKIGIDFASEMANKIDAALKFAELGASADPIVAPILLYYSCAHLCGVFSRAFFEWECDIYSHGLTCRSSQSSVENTKISVETSGQFPRVAVACFMLFGQPNCFSPLVTYSRAPTNHTSAGSVLERFGKNEIGKPLTSLSLNDLATFQFGPQLKLVRQHHGFHKFKGLAATAFLIDVMGLFVASHIARYDVLGWNSILEGRDNSLRLYFEETFDRYLSFTIDQVLAILANPSVAFDTRLLPSQPNPYSHDDHYRFTSDPDNHQ